ncbi:hypothetical protein [Fructobacillus tropaeoli]|uniref:hypothetical protein n=1 Tax=Fructobacillus tropaeoli TaxID=709323 RepID=UPI001943EC00|nr:hypothetical protein [Fructobacillus tropaeoli]GIC69789.1 hypothetical protein FT12353_04270 [Fructobacillus tropaeoli]
MPKLLKHLFPSHKTESHYGYEVRAGKYVPTEVFHETEDFLNYVEQQSQDLERRGLSDQVGLLKSAPSGEYLFGMIFDLPARGDIDSQLADFYTKKKLPYDSSIFNRFSQSAEPAQPNNLEQVPHADDVTAENADLKVATENADLVVVTDETTDAATTESQPVPSEQPSSATPVPVSGAVTADAEVETPEQKDLKIQHLTALLAQQQAASSPQQPAETVPPVNPELASLQEDVSSAVVKVLEEKQAKLSALLNQSDQSGTIRRETQQEYEDKRIKLLDQVKKTAARDLEEAKRREKERYEQALRDLDDQFDKTQAHLVVEVDQSIQHDHDQMLEKRLDENQKQLERLLSAREELTTKIHEAKQLFS